jgi:AmmeMemoRadiSam system protein A
MIDDLPRQRLVMLARTALEARVRNERLPAVPADVDIPTPGLFVTIYCAGSLRGCLGTLDPRERLGRAIVRLAAGVACEDYRFPPLAVHELGDVTVHLSILTAPEPVNDWSVIEVGRDGLIIEHGRQRGLLLPQVATEQGWDRETLLMQTCLKAGLPADAWRSGAAILRFRADVFGEDRRTGNA